MKRTSFISLLICCIAFSTTFSSCEDMLSPDSERHAYEVGKDTLYSYWGILKSLQNVAERYVILGECRGELVSGTAYVSDSIRTILDFNRDEAVDGSCRYLKASDYYHVINSCNAYLAMCDRERVTGTLQPYMLKEAAQVEAIRAWVYLQLVQVYKEVPFYTDALLTTDDIDAFMNAPETVTADNLADKLNPFLQQALQIEHEYGYPDYLNYGYTRTVCHSSKAMIPLSLILGDLYLAKGDLALSVGMTGVSTLLAPLLTPLLTWALAGKSIQVNVASMFLSILWVVILPIAVGLVVKWLWPRFTKRITEYLPAFSSLAIAAIVSIVIGANAEKLLAGGLIIVLVVMLLVLGFGFSARAQVFIINDNVFQDRMSEITVTVEFNASSFRVGANAMLKDLLQRMPGMEIN